MLGQELLPHCPPGRLFFLGIWVRLRLCKCKIRNNTSPFPFCVITSPFSVSFGEKEKNFKLTHVSTRSGFHRTICKDITLRS